MVVFGRRSLNSKGNLGGRVIRNVPESQIIKIWQHLLSDRTELTTEGGELIKIIYPGRFNDDRGADFRDAVIATSRGLMTGDIEVHVKSSGWRVHRHHHDPVYDQVVLHVVMWNDTESATNLHNGGRIPTVALNKYIKLPISPPSNGVYTLTTPRMPCVKAADGLTTSIVAEFLDTAGEERFLTKAARFEADLTQMESSQCLYQGIMGALGYSRNKAPFMELARRLPLQALESITQGKISDEESLARQQALLLGTAGLLPSQCPNWRQEDKQDRWIDKLEELWASFPQTEAMSASAWHLFKVRPNNFPVRRLVAMSYLVHRYRPQGMFKAIVNMINEAGASNGHHRLGKGLLVTTNGYWASHFDSGFSRRLKMTTLIGARRAADIAVNVLLPFALAWGKASSLPGLERKALDLYRRYPRLVVNTVERHMKNQLDLDSRLVNSARRQQGLIHIYNNLCTQGRCDSCPLGKAV